jgi:outer membrane protein OmpA-like peptidoglycan-associated protein
VGAAGAVPFSLAKVKIETAQQLAILKSYTFKKGASITVTGYASKTAGEDDLRVSLDRALEVKNALAKLHPDLVIKAVGGGVTKNPLCSAFANQCAVVKVTR